MVSRVLGYVRDFFIARIFGAGLLTDAFFVAFKIPNLLRRLFAEGAFSQAFVPILAEYKNRGTPEETRALIDAIARCCSSPWCVAAALGMAAGAAHRLPHRAGLRRRAGEVRAHRAAAAHHLSLHRLHLAGRARRPASSTPGAASRCRRSRRRCSTSPSSSARRSSPTTSTRRCWCWPGRCSPAALLQLAFQVPFLRQARPAAALAAGPRAPGRAARPAPDGAGGVRRLGEPGVAAASTRSSPPSCRPAACPGSTTPTG